MTPDRWLVLTVRVPSEELTDELAEGLVALGGAAVEEEVDLLTTYVAPPPDHEAFLRIATERLAGIAGREPEMLWRWQDDEDWSRRWRDGLEPRRVGRRLVVTQPWNEAEPEVGDLVLVIEPATAFGTGEHATTRGALRLLEDSISGGERILDVGTGSGILAIAAVMLGAGRVLAAESDASALGNCRENLERNGVAADIELENAAVDAAYLRERRGAGFDVVVANVLSGVITPLLPAFSESLTSDGRLILGGILEEESAAVLDAARRAGLHPRGEVREAGWWTGLLSAGAWNVDRQPPAG